METTFNIIFSEFDKFDTKKRDTLIREFKKSKCKYKLIEYLIQKIIKEINIHLFYNYLLFCIQLDKNYTLEYMRSNTLPSYVKYFVIYILIETYNPIEKCASSKKIEPLARKESLGPEVCSKRGSSLDTSI